MQHVQSPLPAMNSDQHQTPSVASVTLACFDSGVVRVNWRVSPRLSCLSPPPNRLWLLPPSDTLGPPSLPLHSPQLRQSCTRPSSCCSPWSWKSRPTVWGGGGLCPVLWCQSRCRSSAKMRNRCRCHSPKRCQNPLRRCPMLQSSEARCDGVRFGCTEFVETLLWGGSDAFRFYAFLHQFGGLATPSVPLQNSLGRMGRPPSTNEKTG